MNFNPLISETVTMPSGKTYLRSRMIDPEHMRRIGKKGFAATSDKIKKLIEDPNTDPDYAYNMLRWLGRRVKMTTDTYRKLYGRLYRDEYKRLGSASQAHDISSSKIKELWMSRQNPGKEPWQMTKAEYSTVIDQVAKEHPGLGKEFGLSTYAVDSTISSLRARMGAARNKLFEARVPNAIAKAQAELKKLELSMQDAVGVKASQVEQRGTNLERYNAAIDALAAKYPQLVDEGIIKLKTHPDFKDAKYITIDSLGHKRRVQQALSEGKPVPAEVLADYPDLKRNPAPIVCICGLNLEKKHVLYHVLVNHTPDEARLVLGPKQYVKYTELRPTIAKMLGKTSNPTLVTALVTGAGLGLGLELAKGATRMITKRRSNPDIEEGWLPGPIEVAWTEINSRMKLTSKRKVFKNSSAMEKFMGKLSESGKLYEVLGYSQDRVNYRNPDPTELMPWRLVFQNPGAKWHEDEEERSRRFLEKYPNDDYTKGELAAHRHSKQASLFVGMPNPGEKWHREAANIALSRSDSGKTRAERTYWSTYAAAHDDSETASSKLGMPNPRPPKAWWRKMYVTVKKNYPRVPKDGLSRITAGIWWNMKPKAREYLVQKYG